MSYLWDLSSIRPRTDVVMPGESMPAIFWNAVQQRGPKVWLRQKDFGIWRTWTWNQVGEAVREIGHGLLAIGFDARETASILSNTNVEWVLCDLAVLSANGVSNGIYPTDAAEQVQFLCEDSGTTVLFVEDDEQLDKALEVRDQLPRLRTSASSRSRRPSMSNTMTLRSCGNCARTSSALSSCSSSSTNSTVVPESSLRNCTCSAASVG